MHTLVSSYVLMFFCLNALVALFEETEMGKLLYFIEIEFGKFAVLWK